MDWQRINADVIAEFRANGGRVAMFGDQPVAILHTVGARTGVEREIPLVVAPEGGRMLVYATAAGSPRTPVWVFDLRATPRIEVEIGTERFTADVVELPEAEGEARVAAMAAAIRPFAKYVESAAPRKIPVFEIKRVG